ncbi:MAG: LysR family transcriptional regulator, partial [Pseudomonadota bacterium]
HGSFAKTASELNMTLSSVSMQMKNLEDELGVSLFDRSYRPPKLTPAGRRIARHAMDVLKAADRMMETCRSPDELAGDYRIGFVLTSSIRLLPGFLAHARTKVPNARFSVETGLSDELLVRISNGSLDAAIITRVDMPPGMKAHVLAHEELVYCMPKSAEHWTLSRCMDEMSFIHFMPNTGIGRLIANHLRRSDLHPKDVIVLDSVEAVAECVRAGVGFSILPSPDIERHNKQDMALRSLSGDRVMRELVLAYLENGPLERKAELLAALF